MLSATTPPGEGLSKPPKTRNGLRSELAPSFAIPVISSIAS